MEAWFERLLIGGVIAFLLIIFAYSIKKFINGEE